MYVGFPSYYNIDEWHIEIKTNNYAVIVEFSLLSIPRGWID